MKQKTDFIILDAKPEDAGTIAEIEAECFSHPWSYELIIDEINKNNVIFLVAKADNKVCGYISGQNILDEFYISNVAVTGDYRNSGIGSALIKQLIDEIRNQKCIFATLEVRESNINARRVYEKFGFINLGNRKNFYSSPTEDACIYTLYFNN